MQLWDSKEGDLYIIFKMYAKLMWYSTSFPVGFRKVLAFKPLKLNPAQRFLLYLYF